MGSSATLNYMPWIRLLIADASLMPHLNLNWEDSKSVTAVGAIQIGGIAGRKQSADG